MSRLEEECIAYIGRNRSGIDAGKIDYGVRVEKFENMSVFDLKEALVSLSVIKEKIEERILELEG